MCSCKTSSPSRSPATKPSELTLFRRHTDARQPQDGRNSTKRKREIPARNWARQVPVRKRPLASYWRPRRADLRPNAICEPLKRALAATLAARAALGLSSKIKFVGPTQAANVSSAARSQWQQTGPRLQAYWADGWAAGWQLESHLYSFPVCSRKPNWASRLLASATRSAPLASGSISSDCCCCCSGWRKKQTNARDNGRTRGEPN